MDKSKATGMVIQSISKEQLPKKWLPKWFLCACFRHAFLIDDAPTWSFPTIFLVSSKFICLLLAFEHLLLCCFVQMDVRIELPKAFCQGAQSCHVRFPWQPEEGTLSWQSSPLILPTLGFLQKRMPSYQYASVRLFLLSIARDGACFQKEFRRSWAEITIFPRQGFIAEVSNVWSQIVNWKLCGLRAAWLFWWVRFHVLQHLAFILEGGFRCVMLWAVELKFGGVPKLPAERPEANFSSFGRGQSTQKGNT